MCVVCVLRQSNGGVGVHESVLLFTRVPYGSHKSVYGNGLGLCAYPHPYLQSCVTLHPHPALHAARVKTNYKCFLCFSSKKSRERTTKKMQLSDAIVLISSANTSVKNLHISTALLHSWPFILKITFILEQC